MSLWSWITMSIGIFSLVQIRSLNIVTNGLRGNSLRGDMDDATSRIRTSLPSTSLLKAVCEGDSGAVIALLEEGASVREEYSGLRPLHLAAYNGLKEIAVRLLDHGASVHQLCDIEGAKGTPLHLAAGKGFADVVELLLDRGSDPNDITRTFKKTPLHYVAENVNFVTVEGVTSEGRSLGCVTSTPGSCFPVGSLRAAELLLSRGAEVDASDVYRRTPLHAAVRKGSLELAGLLLSNGASANSVSGEPWCSDYRHVSPMCSSVRNVRMMELLLRHGGDPNCVCLGGERRSILHYAAQLGSEEAVDLLIKHGALVNVRDSEGKTPLWYSVENDRPRVYEMLANRGADLKEELFFAARQGRLETLVDLCRRGADLLETDADGRTCFHLSLRHGREDLARHILSASGPTVFDVKDASGKKPIHLAAQKGFVEILKSLLELGACVNSIDKKGKTPLIHAVKYGRVSATKWLLENDARVDISDDYGRMPLFYAISVRSIDIVSALLDHGASANSNCCFKGKLVTPLDLAVENRLEEIVELLINKGADVNWRDDDKRSVLEHAVMNNCENIVRTLLKYGADVNSSGDGDFLSLHEAVENGNETIVDLLLDAGFELGSRDAWGMNTALHHASFWGNLKMIESILSRGADIDSRNISGETPLRLAAEEEDLEVVKLLVKYGADVDSRDDYGKTALCIASEKRFTGVVAYLLDNDAEIADVDELFDQFENDSYGKQIFARVILRYHSAKMAARDETPSTIHRMFLREEFAKFKQLLHDCECEIAMMMSDEVVCGITFFDVLKEPFERLVGYARNEEFLRVLDSSDLRNKFPIYASALECRYLRARDERRLIDSAKDSLDNLVGFPLPYVVTSEIFKYLGVNGLRCLCNATETSFELSAENK